MATIEHERRKEEHADIHWRRLRDDDVVGENVMTHGRIYQMAVWNNGQRAEVIWDAEMVVVGGPKAGAYAVEFAERHEQAYDGGDLVVAGRSARRIQVWVDAPVVDFAEIETGWMYLRYRKTTGDDATLVSAGSGPEPARADRFRGVRPLLREPEAANASRLRAGLRSVLEPALVRRP